MSCGAVTHVNRWFACLINKDVCIFNSGELPLKQRIQTVGRVGSAGLDGARGQLVDGPVGF